jgi:hypothetical protein
MSDIDRNTWLVAADIPANDLKRAAYRLSQSSDVEDLRSLFSGLQSEARLLLLDEEDDYRDFEAKQLRLAGIFRHLMQNKAPAGHQLLVALTREPAFREVDARRELLIKSLAVVRPAPPEAVQYWQTHALPGSIFVHFVVEALCRNGSKPATTLLATILQADDYPEQFKLYWLRDAVLRHRNGESLLEMCGGLLNSRMAPGLKVAMVMALIDHDEEAWYPPDHLPKPPPRREASDVAKAHLERILLQARDTLDLSEDEKVVVGVVLTDIGESGNRAS